MRNTTHKKTVLFLVAGWFATQQALGADTLRIGLAHKKQVEIRCDGPMQVTLDGRASESKELKAGIYTIGVAESADFFRAAPLVAGLVSSPPFGPAAVAAVAPPDSGWKVELLRTQSDATAARAESDARSRLRGRIQSSVENGAHVLETGPFPNEYLARQAETKARGLGFPARVVGPGEDLGYADFSAPPAPDTRKVRRLVPAGQAAPSKEPASELETVIPGAADSGRNTELEASRAAAAESELKPLDLIPEELLKLEPPEPPVAKAPEPPALQAIPEPEKGKMKPDLGWVPAPGKPHKPGREPKRMEPPAESLPKAPLKLMPPPSRPRSAASQRPPSVRRPEERRSYPPPMAKTFQPRNGHEGLRRPYRPPQRMEPAPPPKPQPAPLAEKRGFEPERAAVPAPPPKEPPKLAYPSDELPLPPGPPKRKPAPPTRLKQEPAPRSEAYAMTPKRKSRIPNVLKSLPIIRRFWWEEPLAAPAPPPQEFDLERGMGRALAEPSETSEEIVSAPSGLPYEFEQPAPPMTGVEEPVEPIRVAEGGPSADPKRVRAEDLLEEGPSFARGEEEEFTLPRTEVDEKPVIEPYSEPSPARLPKESAEPPTLDMDTLIPAAPGESVEEEAPLLVKSAEDGEEVGMTPKRAVDRPGGKPVGIPVTKPISRAYVRIFDEDGQPVTDSATVIDIEPVTSSRLEYNGSSYNGTFQAYAPSDEWLVLVNNADLEDYVAGILPQEIPAEAPFEVLKAQAVVSRCYALQLAQSGEYTEYGYDILGDADSDWPYTGSKKETPSIRNAVEETAGEVLIDSNGGLATPVYCFSSGGYVADALSVWGNSGEPVPEYLKARPDFDPATVGVAISPEGLADDEGLLEEWLSSPPNTFDSEAAGEHFRWKKTLTEDQMDALVNDFWNDQVGHVKSISIIRRAKSGHASEMKIEGELQTVEARDSDTIREALQLDSSLILIKEGWGSGWSVYGGGLGHGVGMSQCGAIGLVKQKKANYKQVLHFYFDELKLGRRQISRSPEGA